MRLSEKLLIEGVADRGQELRLALRGLVLGELVSMIRRQLKMSQRVLAKRAGVPQSTISNLERAKKQPNLKTLEQVFKALFCEMIIVPILGDSIENLLRRQARTKAQMHVQYLLGTMKLEKQEPDAKWVEELVKQETEEMLQSSRLWD